MTPKIGAISLRVDRAKDANPDSVLAVKHFQWGEIDTNVWRGGRVFP